MIVLICWMATHSLDPLDLANHSKIIILSSWIQRDVLYNYFIEFQRDFRDVLELADVLVLASIR